MKDSRITLGQTTIHIDAHYQPGENLIGSDLKLSVSGPDIRELVSISELESLPKDFKFSGSWARTQKGDELNDIVIGLGEMELRLNGYADDLQKLDAFSIRTELNIPDTSSLNSLLKQDFNAGALNLVANLDGSRSLFDVSNLSLKIGNSDLKGDIRVDQRAKLKLTGALESDNLDLRPFQKQEQEPTGEVDSTTGSQGDAPAPTSAPKLVFDDTPIKTLGESPVDLNMQLTVGNTQYGNTELKDLELGVVWEDQLFRLSPMEARDLSGTEINGSVSLDGRGDTPRLDIKINGTDLRLGLAAGENQDPDTYPPVELHVDLHGSGRTRHEMSSSLDGTVRIFMGSGLYASQGLGLIFSDFITELLAVLNPFAKTSEYSRLECGVIAADVESGIITVEPILLHDEKITTISRGEIDLGPETLDLEFRTKPRKGFGLSAGVIINSLIRVGGTLASPAVELDAGSAAVSSGTAVATAGLSLLAKSFSDRFLSSKDPCGDAKKKLDKKDAEKAAGGQ